MEVISLISLQYTPIAEARSIMGRRDRKLDLNSFDLERIIEVFFIEEKSVLLRVRENNFGSDNPVYVSFRL